MRTIKSHSPDWRELLAVVAVSTNGENWCFSSSVDRSSFVVVVCKFFLSFATSASRVSTLRRHASPRDAIFEGKSRMLSCENVKMVILF